MKALDEAGCLASGALTPGRGVLAAVAVFLTLLSGPSSAGDGGPKGAREPDLTGTWVVTGARPGGPVAGISLEDAERLKGHSLEISQAVLTFQDVRCEGPRLSPRRRSLRKLLAKEFKTTPKALGLGATATVVEVGCENRELFGPLFLRDGSRLLFNWYGLFLEAARGGGAASK
jgi:hypothetical protein